MSTVKSATAVLFRGVAFPPVARFSRAIGGDHIGGTFAAILAFFTVEDLATFVAQYTTVTAVAQEVAGTATGGSRSHHLAFDAIWILVHRGERNLC